MTDIPERWARFECWDGSFSLEYPAEWQEIDPPLSCDASLSCGVRHTLLEAFAFEWEGPPESGGPDLVTVLADGIVETVGQEVGQSDGRVISRREVSFRNADCCERILVSYIDRGLDTTTDYCIVGTGNKAVKVALKVLSPEHDRVLPIFERILSSLTTPWLSGGASDQE